MDFGDGRGILSSEGVTISALRDLRFSSDPNGANSITSVYRYIKNAWKLKKCQRNARDILGLHSRYERHVEDFDDLSFFDALLVLFTQDSFILARSVERVEWISPLLVRVFERGDLLVLVVLKVAVGQISIVFRRFIVIDFFRAEGFRLGLRKVPEEHFENNTVRL